MEPGKSSLTEAQKYLPWVNFVLLLVLLPLVATSSCSKPELVVVGESVSSAVVGDDVSDALESAEDLIESGDFSGAFDMVLVASRLAPSDPKLFDTVVHFVEAAAPSDSDDVLAMAEDLLDRGDSLVYFQRPKIVQAARKRLTGLRQKFLASEPAYEPPSPLAGAKQLLTVAGDEAQPTSVRTKAVEQARSLHDDLQLQIALDDQPETELLTQASLSELYSQIDTVEQQCIESLFAEMTSRIGEWEAGAAKLAEQIDGASNETAPETPRQLGNMADQGFDLLQELMPYSKSGIEAATAASTRIEKTVKDLQRQKSWLYNKQSLALIREVESKDEWTPEEKIRHLVEIHEQLLSPYVLRRHNELWGKVFEELPNEDKKVNAVRMRILQSSE